VVPVRFSARIAKELGRVSKNQGSDGRLTKAERKEQARYERESIQRRQAARKRNRAVFAVVGVVVVAVVVGLIVLLGGNGNSSQDGASGSNVVLPDPATLKGILRTPPPWTNNTDQLGSRLAALKLPELSDAAGALHHHIQLYIFVDGQPVVVPQNIGLSQTDASPLHTHDTTGLMHVESADVNFQPVLGQFMDVWGVYMTSTCLGDSCNAGDRQLRVYVNGDLYTADPTLMPLTDLETVVITFGTMAQLPNPIPTSPPTTG
jgi:hypothetical protein